jgi:hypothetical protein
MLPPSTAPLAPASLKKTPGPGNSLAVRSAFTPQRSLVNAFNSNTNTNNASGNGHSVFGPPLVDGKSASKSGAVLKNAFAKPAVSAADAQNVNAGTPRNVF